MKTTVASVVFLEALEFFDAFPKIRNKLQVGDILEIIIPNKIEPFEFKIEELWNHETEEEILEVSPGVKGQKVKMKLPIQCGKDWILRRKK